MTLKKVPKKVSIIWIFKHASNLRNLLFWTSWISIASKYIRNGLSSILYFQGRHSNQCHRAMALVVFCLASKPCFKNLPLNYNPLKYIAKKPQGLKVALDDFRPNWRQCLFLFLILLLSSKHLQFWHCWIFQKDNDFSTTKDIY